MVADYRLNREAQIQAAEGVFRQDEDYRATTFKEWLQAFEWDSARERHEQGATDREGAERGVQVWGHSERSEDVGVGVVPAPRTGGRDRLAVIDAGEGVAELERAEQLTRWHTDDVRAHGDERGADDVADLYDRSA